ncbi:MAG: hypothetical protein GX628_10115 [Clostridiales bacterium]|nr:hypothetical protein [Clostridiales bacterium]
MRSIKKLLALLTAALMLAGAAACGAPGAQSAVTSDTAADTEPAETTTEGYISGVPDDADFEGAEVRVLNSPTQQAAIEMLSIMESDGDIINDAMYKRNLDVMKNLNVELVYTNDINANACDAVTRFVQAGDDSYELVLEAQYQQIKIILQGMYADIIDAPYIDVSMPWWPSNYIHGLNIGNTHRYLLTGDASPDFLRWIATTYYNKQVYADFFGDADGLYQTVLDGEWTLDLVNTMTESVYSDLNGNGKNDMEDMLGCLLNTAASADAIYFNAGAVVVYYDKDGAPVLDPVTDRTIKVVEQMYRLFYENPATGVYGADWNMINNQFTAKFAADEMLFNFAWMFTADYLRAMESDYGVIPYPKSDESVEEYRAMPHNDVSCYAIPAACQNVELACAALEELAYLGYMNTSPAYYEIAMKTKYMRDSSDVAAQMMDLIHDSAFSDTGYVFASQINSAGYLGRDLMGRKSKDVVSYYATKEEAAKAKFAEFVALYMG